MPDFNDVPQMSQAHYQVDVPWDHLEDWLEGHGDIFDLDPDFQRAHVWTEAQQIAYVEWIMRGGESGRELTFNCPGWPNGRYKGGEGVIVGGKQRLHAVRRFLRGEIAPFGHRFPEWTGRMRWHLSFRIRIGNLKTREQVLLWYLDFNAGGTQHTAEEIEKVRRLLAAEKVA